MSDTLSGRPLVRCSRLSKYFGGVRAIAEVSFDLFAGEIVALVGDNGAGKSTLVRILAGFQAPDQGEIWLDGSDVTAALRWKAAEEGIEMVHQHLLLCDNLGAAANVMLGREPVRRRFGPVRLIDERGLLAQAVGLLDRVGATITDYDAPVRQLSGGQRQAVAIARALVSAHRLVMFDEPTAALGARQTAATLQLIRSVAASGIAVILISHNLDNVFQVADRVLVMRHGRLALDSIARGLNREAVVSAMMGVTLKP
jgi:simple sugar transport system ATP-binding protein